MPNVYKWSNVTVSMQSALGTAISISSIAVGATATVTTGSAHSYTTGDFVLIAATGMRQVDGRVYRIASASGSTFVLEGEDTTSYDAFISGTVKKITYGTNIATATNLSASAGSFQFIDVTTIHVNARQQIPGLPDAINYEFTNLWDPADTGLIAMKAASDNQAQRAFRFQFGTGGPKVVFNGYVGCTMLPGGQAQDKVETNATITMFGVPTIYAS